MMPDRKRHKSQTGILSNSGFTLIELLVTMAIVSIVLAAVVSIYFGLSRSYTKETATATAQQNIRSGVALMVQDIRQAGLDPLGTAGGGITLNSSSDIDIIADMDYDGSVTVGNMEQTRYFLSGTQLIQRLDNNAATDLVLVDNVAALNFTFTLDDDGVTPLMVEVNITVTEPAGQTGTVTRTLTEQVKIRN
jgi:prepilin-type N-terminal cleavage/methylation domain-containing protein